MAAAAPDVEQELLNALKPVETLNSEELAATVGVSHQAVIGAIKSLESGGLITSAVAEHKKWKLSAEGTEIAKNGSPEAALWALLADGEVVQADLKKQMGAAADIALSNGMKSKLFKLTKAEGIVKVGRNPATKTFTDTARAALVAAQSGAEVDAKDVDALKKRKLAALEVVKVFTVSKAAGFTTVRVKPVSDITREMLLDGSWATANFKKYTLDQATGKEPAGGQLHPLLKVRQEFREMFLELGFQEMETTRWVDSSFWNFDTLFVPQKHPARDMQDTFFISKPENSKDPEEEYFNEVKSIHEHGYCADWSAKESRRNVLRTHTTACTAWTLYHLAQCSPKGPDGLRAFKPGKYFSIDRVFRNEEMDKTHLCEFHQVEGFVVDRNLSLANMMHMLESFFKKIGIEQLRFKPAFNPYTEPSMEIFGYHSGMKCWMEVGNSGMFRPEMLKPMGFDSDVTAIAWGLSLERPTMIKYGIKNIHELFGHKVDLKFIKRSKICRY